MKPTDVEASGPKAGPRTRLGLTVANSGPPSLATKSQAARSASVFDLG